MSTRPRRDATKHKEITSILGIVPVRQQINPISISDIFSFFYLHLHPSPQDQTRANTRYDLGRGPVDFQDFMLEVRANSFPSLSRPHRLAETSFFQPRLPGSALLSPAPLDLKLFCLFNTLLVFPACMPIKVESLRTTLVPSSQPLGTYPNPRPRKETENPSSRESLTPPCEEQAHRILARVTDHFSQRIREGYR